MWIPNIADTKRTFRKAGRVADFCEICGMLRPFSVDRADEVVRVFYGPLGSTREVWWLGRCESCGLLSVLDQHRYARISSRRTASMEDLLQETFPDALERCRELLNDFESDSRFPRNSQVKTDQ
jgi:hypothetical protein